LSEKNQFYSNTTSQKLYYVRIGRRKFMHILRIAALSLVFLFVGPVFLRAQIVQEFKPPKTDCCLPSRAQSLADQLLDWNQLGRYHEENEIIRSISSLTSERTVFMGDSITDMWKLSQYFPDKFYINRGISGQTTSQMLVRMYPDVIDLYPFVMVVLAGTNDIARNTGPQTLEMIQDNFRAMADLAKAHKIRLVICSLLPVSDYTARKQTVQRPPADIRMLNEWLRNFAKEIGAVYADYYAATVDSAGFLKAGLSMDGLHPNDKGYELMVPIVQAAIEQAQK
jgi:lysophospholipase L1-like esterase